MSLLNLQFPKEVGLFRKIVHTQTEFEKYWGALRNSQCAYMSVYSFRAVKPNGRRAEYNTAIVGNFVLDFDKKYRKGSNMIEVDGDEVVDQVARLHQYLLDKNVKHAVWFSGNGFHIWIALDKTHLPSSGIEVSHIKAAGRKVINEWKADMELYCMDPTVPFDMARMIRVPNSYNAKQHVLRWSIPLTTKDLSLSWDEICEMAETPLNKAYYYGEHGVNLPIKEVKNKNFRVAGGEPIQFDTVNMGKIKILPCLMEAACQVGSNPPHVSRASLVMYLGARLRNFLHVSRTTTQMREKHVATISEFLGSLQWADYDEGVTTYHTKTIVDTGYQESCASLMGKGLCIGKCQLWDGTGEHEGEERNQLSLKVSEVELIEARNVQKRFDLQKTHDKFTSSTNYIGYLGELVFNRHLNSIGLVDDKEWMKFVTPEWDDADFIIHGYTIDLKTTFSGGMWFQEPKHDIYIGAHLSNNQKTMTVLGWIGKKEMIDMKKSNSIHCKRVNRGDRTDWVINPSALHDLTTLPFKVIA